MKKEFVKTALDFSDSALIHDHVSLRKLDGGTGR